MIHVTLHAIRRFRERIADLPEADVIALLSSPAIQAASDFGARFVRLAGNHRVVIKDGSVVTVLPAGSYQRQVMRKGLGRYGVGGRFEEYDDGRE